MVFGKMHCSKCGQEYNNAAADGEDYTYECRNCGQVEVFHIDGTNTTFDCPICAKKNLAANLVPNDINRNADFSDKHNSQFAGQL